MLAFNIGKITVVFAFKTYTSAMPFLTGWHKRILFDLILIEN
jgi:hypothetical protein